MNVVTLTELPDLLRPAIEKYREDDALIEILRLLGAFRLSTPRELGGYEAMPAEIGTVLERVARIDGRAAWMMMNVNLGHLAGRLGAAATSRIWGTGPDPLIAFSGQAGRLGDDGLSGRWKVVGQARTADWFLVSAVAANDIGRQWCIVPRAAVSVTDDGGRIVAKRVTVEPGMVWRARTPARNDRPAYHLPTATDFAARGAAILLGRAWGARDEGPERTRVAIARARLQELLRDMDRVAGEGGMSTEALRADLDAAIWVAAGPSFSDLVDAAARVPS